MLKVSKLADYALMLLVKLAEDERMGGGLMSAQELATQTGLSKATATKILKAMGKDGGLVEAVRGKMGGYRLLRSPDQITVLEVWESIDGPYGLTDCCRGQFCRQAEMCNVAQGVAVLSNKIAGILSEKTLSDMVSD